MADEKIYTNSSHGKTDEEMLRELTDLLSPHVVAFWDGPFETAFNRLDNPCITEPTGNSIYGNTIDFCVIDDPEDFSPHQRFTDDAIESLCQPRPEGNFFTIGPVDFNDFVTTNVDERPFWQKLNSRKKR